jgi:Fe-S cluster assembly protein SufD
MTMLGTMDATNVFGTDFSAMLESDPLGSLSWLAEVRREAMGRFLSLGIPTTKDEEWRYTNVRSLATTDFSRAESQDVEAERLSPYFLAGDEGSRLVFVNGVYDASLSCVEGLPDGLTVGSLRDVSAGDGSWLADHFTKEACVGEHAFVAMNTALMGDAAVVHVASGVVVDSPVHVVFVSVGGDGPTVSYPRLVVVAEANSQVCVVETYAGLCDGTYFTNTVSELIAADNAVVDHYKIQREGDGCYHIGGLYVRQGRDSTVRTHAVSLGGVLTRNDISVVLDGEGGCAEMNGVCMLHGDQLVDHHLRVDHAQPHCDSREYFKGVLDDRSSHVFTGRIIVRKDAQKTDGKQTNQNLLLSDEASAYSKPQLEILADDVKCTHGATIGQIDRNALFYLQSRGVNRREARSLLVYAFASECIERIRLKVLRDRMNDLMFEQRPDGQGVQSA